MSLPELLSPAGNKEALVAAVNAGADAVYLGGSKFSARAYAGNFSKEELREYVDYCHLRDVRVYIAVNTLIKDNEIEEFMEYVQELYKMGVSALILQDIGMICRIAEVFPDFELHASTQMTTNTVWDALFLKERGLKRVVLSRELHLSEIQEIKQKSGLETEVFIHGALCLCYSGKCYFSSMNGGRSGNRGACAQPCREEYESRGAESGKYFLSPKDMNTLQELPEILRCGIDSLKIEGRMKRREYVYLVTRNYKKAIEKGEETDLSLLSEDLGKVFNRSFTRGYLLGDQGEAIINTEFQKPRGTEAARVIRWDKKKKRLKIILLDSLQKGDGLSLGEKVGRIIKEDRIEDAAKAGEIVELDWLRSVPEGTILYKTYDHLFMDRLEQEMREEKKLKVAFFVCLRRGKEPYAVCRILSDKGEDFEARAEVSHRIEEAGNLPLTEEKIREQFSKLGDYPFRMDRIEIEMDEGIHLPVKILNQLRRKVLDEVMEKKISSFRREGGREPSRYGDERKDRTKEKRAEAKERRELRFSLRIRSEEQLLSVCQSGESRIDRIYTDSLSLYQKIRHLGIQAVFCLPSVIRQRDLEEIDRRIGGVEHFMSSSMGPAWKYPEKCLIVDYPLNLYNSPSHNFYHRRGIETTLSIESLYAETDTYVSIENPAMTEVPIYLYPRLMTTEYCPHKGRDGNCMKKTCQLPHTEMSNRKGETFLFAREIGCKSVIFPALPKKLTRQQIRDKIREGYSRFRLEFLREDQKETARMLQELRTLK